MEGGGSHGFKKPRPSSPEPKPKNPVDPTPVGGGGGNGGGGGPSAKDECDVTISTVLSRIAPEALREAGYGAPLEVNLVEENGQPRLIIANGGNRIGDVNDANALKIVGCIRLGRKYVAVIIERQENYCRVRIQLAE